MEHIDEEVKKQKYSLMADQLIKNLKARRYETYYCSDKEEAKKKVLELLTPGCSIGWGGSMTFEQLELKDILREKGFRLIDRDQAKTKEEKRELTVKASQADVFFASANAIDMKGEIFETDGMGGRVAAIVYEAKEVILLIGMNKVVQSQEEAVERVKNYASPLNALRLKRKIWLARKSVNVSTVFLLTASAPLK